MERNLPAFFAIFQPFFQPFHIISAKSLLKEKYTFYKSAGSEWQKIDCKLEKRHIFVTEPHIVACRQADFKTVIF